MTSKIVRVLLIKQYSRFWKSDCLGNLSKNFRFSKPNDREKQTWMMQQLIKRVSGEDMASVARFSSGRSAGKTRHEIATIARILAENCRKSLICWKMHQIATIWGKVPTNFITRLVGFKIATPGNTGYGLERFAYSRCRVHLCRCVWWPAEYWRIP